MTNYHLSTFELLGVQPKVSVGAIAELERAEQQLGFRLPPAVREWFCYAQAVEILKAHSNDDHPIPPARFAIVDWQSEKLLIFKWENQGVCEWSIILDGSDDPPVYVDVDSNRTAWHLVAPSFSAYVYSCVWDYRQVLQQPGLVEAQNGSLTLQAITDLERIFVEEAKTYGWPGSTQHRFSSKDAAILIWSGDDQADWFVGAHNETSLETALRAVWGIDSVGQSFYDCTDLASRVLNRVRGVI